jgi:hypothetical protein
MKYLNLKVLMKKIMREIFNVIYRMRVTKFIVGDDDIGAVE